jgi:hypothetical protein
MLYIEIRVNLRMLNLVCYKIIVYVYMYKYTKL